MKYWMIVLLVVSLPAMAGDRLLSKAQADVLAQDFMEQIAEERFKEAFDLMRPHWPLPSHEVDNVVYQTELQRAPIIQRLGRSIGSEFVKEEKLGESFLRQMYFEKFENHAIAWLITFYKPSDKWIVNQIVFVPQVDMLY